MPSAAITWIVLSCYLLSSWNGISLGQRLSYPIPSLQVIPSNVIAKGENFTIRCQGPLEDVRFHVFRDIYVIQSQDPPGNVAEFHFTNARQQDAGTYKCRYNPTSDGAVYSEASDPINLQVRDTFPKPSLQVSPGNVITRGGTLTVTCTGERPNMRFTLRWRGADQQMEEPPGMQAVFTVRNVQYEGNYDCYYQTKSIPTVFSEQSESRHIRVLDLPKASISLEPVPGAKGDYKIHCSAPKDQNVKWFFLNEDGVEHALMDRSVPPGKHNVAFPVSSLNGNTCLRCRCSYQIIESGESVLSPLSDLVDVKTDIESVTESAGTVPVPGTESVEGGAKTAVCVCTDPDFSQRIIVQSVMVVVVLLVLLVILAEHVYSIKKKNA